MRGEEARLEVEWYQVLAYLASCIRSYCCRERGQFEMHVIMHVIIIRSCHEMPSTSRGSTLTTELILSFSRAQQALCGVRCCLTAPLTSTHDPMGPSTATVQSISTAPAPVTRPLVGLRPVTPQKEAGMRMEPPPSEPAQGCAWGTTWCVL